MPSASGVYTDGVEFPPCGVCSPLFQGGDITKHRGIYREHLAERLVPVVAIELLQLLLLFNTFSGRRSKLERAVAYDTLPPSCLRQQLATTVTTQKAGAGTNRRARDHVCADTSPGVSPWLKGNLAPTKLLLQKNNDKPYYHPEPLLLSRLLKLKPDRTSIELDLLRPFPHVRPRGYPQLTLRPESERYVNMVLIDPS